MKKKTIALIAGIAVVLCAAIVAGVLLWPAKTVDTPDPTEPAQVGKYTFVNAQPVLATPDEEITLDGDLDEKVYQDNNWLYLHNENGASTVDVAVTSWFGKNGMYFAYDVTETTPIYVNPIRSSYMNSGIEMYLAMPDAASMDNENAFEIDLQADGTLTMKRRDGYGFTDVATTHDIMARLAVATKGGEVNSEDCNGYTMEFFIPWAYLDYLGIDSAQVQKEYVHVDVAHITSYNYAGTDTNVDRTWHSFVMQNGVSWGDFANYFGFNGKGAMGTVPVTWVAGEHYSFSGAKSALPGMNTVVTVTPDEGYALSSILVNGEEYIHKVSYNEDGSVTLNLKATSEGLTISAKAEAITPGNKTLSGQVLLHRVGGDSLDGVEISYKGPQGEKPITLDKDGKFSLKDLAQGYYTITVEKKGYKTLTRSIALNRNMDTELTMEYDFLDTNSNAWDVSSQNDGVISYKGYGDVLSTQSYNSFYLEGYFRFDPMLALNTAGGDGCTQQRTGFRIVFSNGATWHPDLLRDNGQDKVQYGKLTGTALYNWNTVYQLNSNESSLYTGSTGLKFAILRVGRYANVFVNDKLVAVEDFGAEFEDLTAQVGFESYVANSTAQQVKYTFRETDLPTLTDYVIFTNNAGWDLTESYNGVISLTSGGFASGTFARSFVNMDLTIQAMDSPYGDTDPRNQICMEFSNGQKLTFDILSEGSRAFIQSFGDPGYLFGWTDHGNLTDAELAQYRTSTGIPFRVVRKGTYFYVYVGDRLAKAIDLSDYISADTSMTVSIKHWDDNGAYIRVPFSVSGDVSGLDLPDLGAYIFTNINGWDVSGQLDGYITLPAGGYGSAEFVKRYTDMDLTVRTMDHPDGTTDPRNQVRFIFDNGKAVTFDILAENGNVFIQSFGMGDEFLMPWTNQGSLSQAEIEQFRTANGVDFRIVRKGTKFYLYIGERLAKTIDLSDEISASTSMRVILNHYDDNGAALTVPFKITDDLSNFSEPEEKWTLFEVNPNVTISEDETTFTPNKTGEKTGMNINSEQFVLTYHVTGHSGGDLADGLGFMLDTGEGDKAFQFGFIDGGFALRITNEWSGAYNIGGLDANKVCTDGVDVMIVRDGSKYAAYYRLNENDAWKQAGNTLTLEVKEFSMYNWSKDYTLTNITYTPSHEPIQVTMTAEAMEHGSVALVESNAKLGDTVTLTVTPDEGYFLNKLTVNGADYTGLVKDGKLVLNNVGWTELKVSALFGENQVKAKLFQDSDQFQISEDETELLPLSQKQKIGMNINAEQFVSAYHVSCVDLSQKADGIGFRIDFEGGNRTYQFGFIDGGYALRITDQWSGKYGLALTDETVQTNGMDILIVRDGSKFTAYYRLNENDAWAQAGDTLTLDNITGFSIYNWSTGYQLTNITYTPSHEPIQVKLTAEAMEHGSVTMAEENAKLGDTVTLNVNAEEGYFLSQLTVNGKDFTAQVQDGKLVLNNVGWTELKVSARFGQEPVQTRLFQNSDQFQVSEDETELLPLSPKQKIGLNIFDEQFVFAYHVNCVDLSQKADGIGFRIDFNGGNRTFQFGFIDGGYALRITDQWSGKYGLALNDETVQSEGMDIMIVRDGSKFAAYYRLEENGDWAKAGDTLDLNNITGFSIYNWSTGYQLTNIAYTSGHDALNVQLDATVSHGTVALEGSPKLGEDVTLVLTAEERATLSSLVVNGQNVTGQVADGKLTLSKYWKSTVKVEAKFLPPLFQSSDQFQVSEDGTELLPLSPKQRIGMNIDSEQFVLAYHVNCVDLAQKADGLGFRVDFNGGNRTFQFGFIDGGYALRITDQWSGKYGLALNDETVQSKGMDILIVRDGSKFAAYYRLDENGDWAKAGDTLTLDNITGFSIYNWSTGYKLTNIAYTPSLAPVTVALNASTENGTVTLEGTPKLGEDVTLNVIADRRAVLTSLTVNGTDMTDHVENGKLALGKVWKTELTVEAKFEKLPALFQDSDQFQINDDETELLPLSPKQKIGMNMDSEQFVFAYHVNCVDLSQKNDGIGFRIDFNGGNRTYQFGFIDGGYALRITDQWSGKYGLALNDDTVQSKGMDILIVRDGSKFAAYYRLDKDGDWAKAGDTLTLDNITGFSIYNWSTGYKLTNITYTASLAPVTVELDATVSHGTVALEGSPKLGEDVTLVLTPEETATLTSLVVNGQDVTDQVADGKLNLGAYWKTTLKVEAKFTLPLFQSNDQFQVSQDGTELLPLSGGQKIGMNIDAERFELTYHVTLLDAAKRADGLGFRVDFNGGNRTFQFGFIDGGYALRITDQWSGKYGLALTDETAQSSGIDVKIVRDGSKFSAYYRLSENDDWAKAGDTLDLNNITGFSIYNWSAGYKLTNIHYTPNP